jgi:hypothetical protein
LGCGGACSVCCQGTLRAFFGFILEGRADSGCLHPEEVTLTGFRTADAAARVEALREAALRMIKSG